MSDSANLTPDNEATAAQGVEARTHTLKTDEDVWLALRDGTKTAEFRRDDRGFEVGDVLRLRHGTAETGIVLRRVISHIVRGPLFGIPEGYALLSLAPEPARKKAARDAAPADLRALIDEARTWRGHRASPGSNVAFAANTIERLADALERTLHPAVPPAQPASQAETRVGFAEYLAAVERAGNAPPAVVLRRRLPVADTQLYRSGETPEFGDVVRDGDNRHFVERVCSAHLHRWCMVSDTVISWSGGTASCKTEFACRACGATMTESRIRGGVVACVTERGVRLQYCGAHCEDHDPAEYVLVKRGSDG